MDDFSSRPRFHSDSTTDDSPPPTSASSKSTPDTVHSRHPALPPKIPSNFPQPNTFSSTPIPPSQQQVPLPVRQAAPITASSTPNPNFPSSRPLRTPTTNTPVRFPTSQQPPLRTSTPPASSTKSNSNQSKVATNPSKSLNRPVGLAALTAQSQKSARFASHGTNLRRANDEALASQFTTFQRQLHEFSIKHGAEIRQNAHFRGEFAKMCAALGVDPLAAAVEGAKAKAKAEAAFEPGTGGEKIEKKEREKEKGIAGLKGLFWERVGRKVDSGTKGEIENSDDDTNNSNTSLYDPNYNYDHDHSQFPEDGEDQGLSAETKNHLAEMLGGSINQFYWELGLRIVQIVIETRTENGGLIELAELKKRVRRPIRRGSGLTKDGGRNSGGTAGRSYENESESDSLSGFGSGLDVSEQDIIHAIHSLAPLGPGYTIITIRRTRFLRSVPREFNRDQTTVLAAMQVLGYATVSMLRANLDWSSARAYAALQDLVVDSVAWVDREEGVFWETGAAEDVDGYVGGVWENRYWAASWMYKRRDGISNNDNNQRGGEEGGGNGSGNRDTSNYDETREDEDGDTQDEDLDHGPEVFASNLSKPKAETEGAGEGKVRTEDDIHTPNPHRTNTEKRINDNNDDTHTAKQQEEKEEGKDDEEEAKEDNYGDEDDSDEDDGSEEDEAAFEQSQERIMAELKAFLEAKAAESTSSAEAEAEAEAESGFIW